MGGDTKMKKNKIQMYLDGFINIYKPNENKTNFGAKKNVRVLSEMTHLYKLAYVQSYQRGQDLDFAESMGRDLSLKIKVRLVNGITNDCKVVINNTLYDIIYMDEDRVKRELYLYLEEMYPIE